MRYVIENRRKKTETRLTRELVLGIVISIVQDMPTSIFLNKFSIKLSSMKRYARDLKMAKEEFTAFSFYNSDARFGPYSKMLEKDKECPLSDNQAKHIERLSRLVNIYDEYETEFKLYFFRFTEFVAYNPHRNDNDDKIIIPRPLTAMDLHESNISKTEKRKWQRDFNELINASIIIREMMSNARNDSYIDSEKEDLLNAIS